MYPEWSQPFEITMFEPSRGDPASCVCVTFSLPSFLSKTSHAQPEPKCPAAAAENSRLKLSKEPKEESIKEATWPVGAGTASADLGGAKDCRILEDFFGGAALDA